MYSYHNRIKQRIRAGELVDFEFVEDYPGIGEALVLRFSTRAGCPACSSAQLSEVRGYSGKVAEMKGR